MHPCCYELVLEQSSPNGHSIIPCDMIHACIVVNYVFSL